MDKDPAVLLREGPQGSWNEFLFIRLSLLRQELGQELLAVTGLRYRLYGFGIT